MSYFLPIEALNVVNLDKIDNSGLVLRFGDYSTGNFLIAGVGELYAIFLDGEWSYSMMPISQAGRWQGLYVNDTQIRVDLTSAFDPNETSAPAGALVKSSDCLYILATNEGQGGFPRRIKVPLFGEVNTQNLVKSVGFSRWNIGIVVDDLWHSLLCVDAIPDSN